MAAVDIVAHGRLRQQDCEIQVIQSYIEMHAASKGRECKTKEMNGVRRKGTGGREEASCLHTLEVSLDHFRESFIMV